MNIINNEESQKDIPVLSNEEVEGEKKIDNSTILAKDFQNMVYNATVYSSYNGQSVTLVFNESMVMPEKNSFIEIILPKELNSWRVILKFDKDFQKPALSVSKKTEGNKIYLTHHWWEGDDWIESSIPEMFQNTAKTFTLFIKVRSKAPTFNDFRTVQISIWKKV